MKFSKLDYCQYLLSTQINYTLTYLAEHNSHFSHDTINRYLRRENLSPSLLWDNVKQLIQIDEQAYIIFDDTVLDKRYSRDIELTRRQYSGNEHRVIQGIGLVTCLYVNPKTDRFWVIDYRIYDPDSDGLTKLEHVTAMLESLVQSKLLPFNTVLMDSWYATTKLMQLIDSLDKYYYCPLKKNRLVDDTGGREKYQKIETLLWNHQEVERGKVIKIKGFSQAKKVKLFRVFVSTDKTEYVATNNINQDSTDDVQQECAIRWKIEEFHRDLKQLTGIEACQCRKARIQRNHIACAILVWTRLKDIAYFTGQTIYELKYGLLDNYLIQQLKRPAIAMVLA